MSHVYFIAAEDAGTVKIGFAKQPWNRLSKMQSDCPHSLRLLAIEAGDVRHEAHLHRRFAVDRLQGEWFRLSQSILDYIAALPVPLPLERRRKKLGGPLGEWLHAHRLTASTFAEKVGTTEATISRICSGKQLPRREIMLAIWRATGGAVTANLLYGIPEASANESLSA